MGNSQVNIGKSRLGTVSGVLPVQNWFFKTVKNDRIFKVIYQKKTSFKVIDPISRGHCVLFMEATGRKTTWGKGYFALW